VDTGDLEAVEAAIRPSTKLIHVETPTNPIMSLTDIAAVSAVAHAHGAEVSVDNTFMSPVLQSPLALGADIVMHSTTKFLNGHSDGLGGALIGSRPEHKERFLLVQKAAGGILSPFECFLVLRGIKTLPLRMRQHEENGRAVAEFLSTQPKLSRLAYPGLRSHPQHELAIKQQKGFGSMMSFDLGTREAAGRFLGALKLVLNAESLGGVESLASHSATTTHFALSDEERERLGITQGLVRISVGIEDKEDLIADLEQALDRV
jgi:cystathionine beta-lyase/cystathionine gamma-synthase